MRLHYFPGTISVAVAIALEEAKLAYDLVLVDFKAAQQTTPDYLAFNPKGRVPVLEADGHVLTETGAILEFIAAKAPDAGFVPTDPAQAAKMRAVMYYVASTMHVNHAHRMRGHRWADQQSSFDDMAAKVPQTMADSAAYVNDNCLAGTFVLGETLSLADAYLFVACNWLAGDGVTVSDYPKIVSFLDAMNARDSVKAVRDKGVLV